MNPEQSEMAPNSAPATAPETSSIPAHPAVPVLVTQPKKKKRRYSRGLREVQQLERSVSKVSARVARAVAKGMTTYRKRSDKSARKKRDGAIRDFAVNLAEGVGKTMRDLSRVPADLARGLNTKRVRRRVRRTLRSTSRLLRPLG